MHLLLSLSKYIRSRRYDIVLYVYLQYFSLLILNRNNYGKQITYSKTKLKKEEKNIFLFSFLFFLCFDYASLLNRYKRM